MVNIKIHRGTSQIGGTITEIFTENTHVFIDFGSELNVYPEESTDNKMIDMIKNAKCDAVLFSHYHGDHIGLMEHIPERDIRGKQIRLGIGKVARKVLINIHKTLANNKSASKEDIEHHKKILGLLRDRHKWQDFTDYSVVSIGDFTITTIRVDHSAYDAYMFVIEAEGKCIVHTGDFRTHGKLGKDFFDRLRPFMSSKKVDVLLMEGTMLGRLDEDGMREDELQTEAMKHLLKSENKYAYLICSSTNLESLASFHKAVLFSNKIKEKRGINEDRAIYVNYYVKEQMDLFAKEEPELTWGVNKANKFEAKGRYIEKLGMAQDEKMEKDGFLCMIGTSDSYKKYIEPYRDKNPLLIYSMWDGYVNSDKPETNDKKLKALYDSFPEDRRIHLHTSGHAVREALEEMIEVVNPSDAIIPIHTENKDKYEILNGIGDRRVCLEDGEIYSLKS